MPVVQLGGGKDNRIQEMMYMQQMMNKSALGPDETALERVLRQQEEQQLNKLEWVRKVGLTNAQVQAMEEKTGLLRERTAAGVAKDQAAVERGLEKSGREERVTKATIPKLEAEQESAAATANLRREEALGEPLKREETIAKTRKLGQETKTEEEKTRATRLWGNEQILDGARIDARGRYATGVAQAMGGNMQMFQGEHGVKNTDNIEQAGKVLFGEDFTVPRDENGFWKPDTKTLANTVMKPDGTYNAEFAKGLHDATAPRTPMQAWLQAAREAGERGDKFEQQMLMDRMRKEILPSETQAKGAVLDYEGKKAMGVNGDLDDLAEVGNFDGFYKAIENMAVAKKVVSAKTVNATKAVGDIEDMIGVYSDLQNVRAQFIDLKKNGKFPTGKMKEGYRKFLKRVGADDADVSTFQGNLDQIVADYINKITGKQANDTEREDLKGAHPSMNDVTGVLDRRLADMIGKTARKIQEQSGFYNELGITVPSLGPDFPFIPPSETMGKWKNKGYWVTPEGRISFDEMNSIVKGKAAMKGPIERAQKQVGGVNESRKAQTPMPNALHDVPTADLEKQMNALREKIAKKSSKRDQLSADRTSRWVQTRAAETSGEGFTQ